MIFNNDNPSSSLQWLTTLDSEHLPHRNYRRSSIIGTIGPKTNSTEMITKLRKGMCFTLLPRNFNANLYQLVSTLCV